MLRNTWRTLDKDVREKSTAAYLFLFIKQMNNYRVCIHFFSTTFICCFGRHAYYTLFWIPDFLKRQKCIKSRSSLHPMESILTIGVLFSCSHRKRDSNRTYTQFIENCALSRRKKKWKSIDYDDCAVECLWSELDSWSLFWREFVFCFSRQGEDRFFLFSAEIAGVFVKMD